MILRPYLAVPHPAFAVHNLDGLRFRLCATSPGGDVTGDTLFHYRQRGNVVWALYAGGGVQQGTLVATMAPNGTLNVRYHHVSDTGELRAGRSRSTPEVLADGRLRYHEQWRWTEGGTGSGTSSIEEVR